MSRGAVDTPTLLIVDDEEALVEALSFSLSREHYRVLTAGSGPEGVEIARRVRPDLVLLDVMLPGFDGFEACRQLRADGFAGTIVLLTAKDQEIDRVVGLEIGADDYVTKPFSTRELVARVKAHLRRERRHQPGAAGNQELRFGELTLSRERREATRQGRKLDLTPKEIELLLDLVEHRGKAVPREALVSRVWGYDYDGDDRVVNVTIQRLRDKLEADPRHPRHIVTVRGYGYMFDPGPEA